MAVRRSATLTEPELLGRYPFLPGADRLIEGLASSLGDLVQSPSLERARLLGRLRVAAALDDPTGAQEPAELARASPPERFLSFVYARLLVAAAPTPAAVRRWAVAEAKTAWRRMDLAPVEELCDIARRLGYGFEPLALQVRIRLPDYVRLATPIREAEFHLVRQAVREGEVTVPTKRAARLLQEGVRVSLTPPIGMAEELRAAVASVDGGFLEEVAQRAPAVVASSGPVGPVRPDLFPPCIRKMRRTLEAGENLSHAGRFALAAFLHRTGVPFEGIVDAYRGAPDFDESITRYQVEHITTRDGGRGYEVPDCDKIRSHGLCFREGDPAAAAPTDREPDPRCFDAKLRHPVQYYRWRGGPVAERSPGESEGAPGTPPAPAPRP